MGPENERGSSDVSCSCNAAEQRKERLREDEKEGDERSGERISSAHFLPFRDDDGIGGGGETASIANYADERSSERERGCTTMRKPPAARQMSQLDDGGGRSTEHGIFRSDEESVCGLKQRFGI